MSLQELQQSWNSFGADNPMWAVLTDSYHWEEDVFFARGLEEINAVLARMRGLWPQLQLERALDFGCGAGRLSQALALQFTRVDGVDIAPSMIEAARSYNRHGERVHYTLNCRDDLSLFADNTFDFIYSNITLQHIRPIFVRQYLSEFTRVLRPGGACVIQLPSHLKETQPLKYLLRALVPAGVQNAYRIAKYDRRLRKGEHEMEMHGLRRAAVERILRRGGMRLLDVAEDLRPTAHHQWVSYMYVAAKA